MAFAIGYAAAGFLLAGFSEVLNPIFCVMLLIFWYRTRNHNYLAVIVGIALGTLIVVLAPGNAIRSATLPPRIDLISGLSNALNVTGLFLIGQALDHAPSLLLAFFVGYLCPSKIFTSKRLRWGILSILISIGIIAFTLFVPLWFTNGLDARHFTFASFTLVLLLFTLGVLCAGSRHSSSSL